MSSSSGVDPTAIALGALEDKQTSEFTRRSMLAGAMATSVVATVGVIDNAALAHSADPNSRQDMVAFVLLSAALTGIAATSLAPGFRLSSDDMLNSDPGSDPVNIKLDYFTWLNERHAPTFESLLQIVKDNRASPNVATAIIDNVNAGADTKYLARSIVLMWYLGAWYEPSVLANAPPSGEFLPSVVVSAKAYTQGWIWSIAQAHPMGYSALQFGYWSRDPSDPNERAPNPPLGFITPKTP
jgi:hypothetical protein